MYELVILDDLLPVFEDSIHCKSEHIWSCIYGFIDIPIEFQVDEPSKYISYRLNMNTFMDIKCISISGCLQLE